MVRPTSVAPSNVRNIIPVQAINVGEAIKTITIKTVKATRNLRMKGTLYKNKLT
jgi:hypothetical protein